MHVLFIVPSLSGGGAERVAVTLANHWAGGGWRVTVATFEPDAADAYPLHPQARHIPLQPGGAREAFGGLAGKNLGRIAALRQLLRRERPDVAIGIMTVASTLLGFARPPGGGVAIGTEHNHPPSNPLGPVRERLRQWSYGRLDAVVALTPDVAGWLTANTRARDVPVIANPLAFPVPAGEPVLRPERHLDAGHKVLLAAGTLAPHKGFDRLIRAFARLAPATPDWTLAILGDGPESGALAALARALGVADRVRLPGRAGNMGDWYAAADAFALTSHHEAFPMVLCEAMAHGLPVVSVDCESGPRHIIRDGIDGLLVPPDDPDRLAEALRRLMADGTLRQELGARAVELRERLSVSRIAREWEMLFQRLLDARR